MTCVLIFAVVMVAWLFAGFVVAQMLRYGYVRAVPVDEWVDVVKERVVKA